MKISELENSIPTISPWPRLGHFIIDLFVIQLISYIIDLIPLTQVTGFLDLLVYPVYYIAFEYFYQCTPGKLVTGTIVINDSGNKSDIQTIILRTFIRFVPFEPFSCFADRSWGWHDRWTKTYVIYKSNLPAVQNSCGANDYSQEINQPLSRKIKMNVLIIAILAAVVLSGYLFVKQFNSIIDSSLTGKIDELNSNDYVAIKGDWNTQWKFYKKLSFKEDSTVIATNQEGHELKLEYIINTKTLTLKDTSGLKLEYIIMEISEEKMIL